MASDLVSVGRVMAALDGLDVTSRFVFNGDCLYCDGKPVGWIFATGVSLKNTGRAVAGTTGFALVESTCERHPSFWVPEQQWGTDSFKVAVQATADVLPDSARRLPRT